MTRNDPLWFLGRFMEEIKETEPTKEKEPSEQENSEDQDDECL